MEIKEYYVVARYDDPNEVPTNIYKVTSSKEEALEYYIIHGCYLENKCGVGVYCKNKLTSIIVLDYKQFDGPGIFKPETAVITKEMIERKNYYG